MSRTKTKWQKLPQGLERRGRFLTESRRPHEILVNDRRRRAVELRRSGMKCEAVGYLLAADPSINSQGHAVPGGYGWQNYAYGKPPPTPRALAQSVSIDITNALQRSASLEAEASMALRAICVDRLETLTSFMWPKASKGDHWAVFRCIQIVERLSKMHGWDSEKRMMETEANLTIQGELMAIVNEQPPFEDPEYMRKFLDALAEGGLAPQEAVDNAKALIPDADVIDAEVVDD